MLCKRSVKRHTVVQPLDPSYRLIALTQRQNAIVDVEDFEYLSKWNWQARWDKRVKSFYACRKGPRIVGEKRKTIYMHRQILRSKTSRETDHWNHDTLDNRKRNLRKCSTSNNRMNCRLRSDNTSGFKGVSWNKALEKWTVFIAANGKHKNIGSFDNLIQAAKVYDAKAKELHGEFAYLNFPVHRP